MESVPQVSRWLDRTVGLVGAALLLIGLCRLHTVPPSPAWLALPLIVVASRAPLVLATATGEALVIGLDSSLLVLLGLTLQFFPALVVWAVSVATAELSSRRTWDTRVFNSGVTVLAGALALVVFNRAHLPGPASPRALAATFLAATVYFAVDYLVSAVSIAAQERTFLCGVVDVQGLPLALGCFLGVDSLGFVAVLVLQDKPWAVPLLAVPFTALLCASRSWSNVHTAVRRSALLSAASLAVQDATEPAAVEALLMEHASRLTRCSAVLLDEAPNVTNSVALSYTPTGGAPGVLVIPPRANRERHSQPDIDALTMLIGVAEQAGERLRLLAELEHTAARDPLTGLANRASFGRQLGLALAAGERLGILYCDLDGFKQVNDTHGHATGDALLAIAAQRLSDAVRPHDLAARLGGDEFAVMLRHLTPADAAEVAQRVADRICHAMAQPYQARGQAARLSVSIGIATAQGGDAEELMQASDAAMYRAKSAGGGRSTTWDRTPQSRREQNHPVAAGVPSC